MRGDVLSSGEHKGIPTALARLSGEPQILGGLIGRISIFGDDDGAPPVFKKMEVGTRSPREDTESYTQP